MKKILLGSTALLGAALLASPAFAQLEVKVGGYVDFQAGFFDGTGTGNDRDFRNDAEVHILPTYKADNGLTYGADIQIESKAGDAGSALGYDEANIFLAGSWGRVELGDQDGASDKLAVFAPVAGVGQFDGDHDEFLPAAIRGVTDTHKVKDSSDASKITYYTPVFAGLQAGVSYAPENGNQGDSVVQTEPVAGYSDFIEGGLVYSGEFSGVGVRAGGTISTADNNAAGADSFTAWGLGAQLSYAGISFGGGYTNWDEADGVDDTWNIGLGYATGPLAVAINYEDVSYVGTDSIKLIGVGGSYTLAQGLALRADYVHVDNDVIDDEGNILILSTRLAF